MDGNHAPSTLNEELEHKTRSGKRCFSSGENPSRNEESRDDRRYKHRTTTAAKLTEVPDDGAAEDGTGFHPNAGSASSGVLETFRLKHKCCVRVLGGVTYKVSNVLYQMCCRMTYL